MYPGTYAAEAPDRVAAVMTGTGETLSYGDLERRSVQLAHVLHEAGLRPGDVVALLTENNLRAFEVYWAALRSGLYITAVNNRLTPDEVAYIVSDSGATALMVSAELAATAEAITGLTAGVKLRLAFGGPVQDHGSYEQTIAAAATVPFADQPRGATMLYSSGTTGRPRESGRRCPASRCPSQARPWRPWPASSSASIRTRSTCRQARSITRRRCAGAVPSRRSAAPWP